MIKDLIKVIENIESSGYSITRLELDGKKMKLKVRGAEETTQKETREETPTQTLPQTRDAYNVSFTVPACDINGQHFDELNVVNESVQLLTTKQGRKIFCFENILFLSAIDENYKDGSALVETPLGIYLENNFKTALQSAIKEKIESVSLLSYDNVFNEDSEDFIPHFKNGAHRIKSFKDITHWYWLSTPHGSNAAYFCYVSHLGDSTSYYASNGNGGVAPAFCIA